MGEKISKTLEDEPQTELGVHRGNGRMTLNNFQTIYAEKKRIHLKDGHN